ncbi:MAG: copper transporter [Bacillota bacterium]
MVDLRYHIATVTALFLALGIGIFIGSTVISDDILIREQEQIVSILEKEFDKLRDENRILKTSILDLEENLRFYNELGEEIFPILARDKLSGYKLGIVITNPDYTAGNLLETIKESGAEFSYLISLSKELYALEKSYLEALLPGMIQDLADLIVKGNITEIDVDKIDFSQQLFNVEGQLPAKVDYVIVIGGNTRASSNYAKILDYPLIKKITGANIKVVGAEGSDVEFSYIPTYKALNIPIVDNVDSIFGKLALIKILETISNQ